MTTTDSSRRRSGGQRLRTHEGPARADVHAVVVEGLCEHFRIPLERPPGLKERLATFRRGRYERFTALKDVSLSIRHGESVAFIGHNGSGKSTLLKCIAGILPADEGRITVHGRVATLLELGAGFVPDLSGRENVYLNASLLGLSRTEVDERFDDIVAFAGVREFIDTPVRNYSSGMYVRLGFAVAVHVDPEILLVDEVLAVGDADFQSRSLARMRSFGQRGKTVVLVSHDLSTITELCTRTIVLDHGRVAFDGPTEQAVAYYLEIVEGIRPAPEEPEPEPPTPARTGDRQARVRGVRLLVDDEIVPAPTAAETTVERGLGPDEDADDPEDDDEGAELPVVASGRTAQVLVSVTAEEAARDGGSLSLGIAVRRPDMQLYVYETRTAWRGIYLAPPEPGGVTTVTFTLDLAVLSGAYLVDLLLANAASGQIHDRWQGALAFAVESPAHEFGVARLDGRIGIWNPDGHYPDDIHAPPPERGGPTAHVLREDRPSPGYEPGVPRRDAEGRPVGDAVTRTDAPTPEG